MPKKKKPVKRTKPKSSIKWKIAKTLKAKQKFLFVLLFAAVGAFLLYQTFAASTTVTYDVVLTSRQATASY